jgi:septal ring factor EnvC (AmiA/AmiB activator)
MRPSALVHFCILALSASLLAQTSDQTRTEALARRASERMQSLQQEADRLATEERTLLGDLRKLELDRQIKLEELRQIDADAAGVNRDLSVINDRMSGLERDEAAARPDLRARIVEMYKLGQARYLRLLLATSDLRRIGEASRTVAALAKLDRDRLAAHQRTIDELRATRRTLESRAARLQTLRTEAQRAQASADRAAQARNALIASIDRQRDLNAQLTGELQAAQQTLQMTLRGLAAGTAAAEPAILPLKPFRGDLDWPAAGALRRRFVRAASSTAGRAQDGIEIAAEEGAPVAAVHDGTVAFADVFAGFGNLVIVDHGAQTFSLYGNLLEMAVKKGGRVDRGQVLGTVGDSPAGQPGLYFELRVDGQVVDPLQWLKKR